MSNNSDASLVVAGSDQSLYALLWQGGFSGQTVTSTLTTLSERYAYGVQELEEKGLVKTLEDERTSLRKKASAGISEVVKGFVEWGLGLFEASRLSDELSFESSDPSQPALRIQRKTVITESIAGLLQTLSKEPSKRIREDIEREKKSGKAQKYVFDVPKNGGKVAYKLKDDLMDGVAESNFVAVDKRGKIAVLIRLLVACADSINEGNRENAERIFAELTGKGESTVHGFSFPAFAVAALVRNRLYALFAISVTERVKDLTGGGLNEGKVKSIGWNFEKIQLETSERIHRAIEAEKKAEADFEASKPSNVPTPEKSRETRIADLERELMFEAQKGEDANEKRLKGIKRQLEQLKAES